MTQDKIQELTRYFKKETNKAEERSKGITSQMIDNLHIKHLTKEQKLIKLRELNQSLEDECDDNTIKDYLLFTSNHKTLLNKFQSRYLLENINDIKYIEKAIILSNKRTAIKQEIELVRSTIPPFKIQEFLSNNNNIFFYQYCCCPPNTPPKHYYKMRESQLHSIMKSIQNEILFMQVNFIQNNPSQLDIENEIDNCKNYKLSHLIAFKNLNIPQDDYTKRKIINPREIFKIKTLDNSKKKDRLSPPEILNISLNKYQYWLEENAPISRYNFNKIFNQEFNKEKNFFLRIASKLNKNENINNLKIINKRLTALNNFHNKIKCHIIDNCLKKKHHMKALFYWHLLFTNIPIQSIALLKISMKLSLLSDFYLNKLSQLEQHSCSYSQAFNLLATLNSDNQTTSSLINSINKSLKEKSLYKKPTYAIIQDVLSQIKLAINTSVEHLDDVYDMTDAKLSALHAVQQHNHIQSLINKLRMLNIEIDNMTEPIDNIFTQKIETFNNTRNIGKINLEIPMAKEIIIHEALSFKYRKSNTESLLNFFSGIDEKIDFLTSKNIETNNSTTPEQLVKILTSDNLLVEKDKIYLKCNTNQFKYIIDKISLLFDNLTYSNIERSMAFFSRKNNLIRTSNLTSSNYETINVKVQINDVFRRFLT